MGSTKFLEKLRSLMQQTKYFTDPIHAYIIPYNDSHMSEYLQESDKRIQYATGFTGSAGTVIVTHKEALLWTDGRYHTQAAEEIDSNWTLMKAGLDSTPSEISWLLINLPPFSRVGIDPKLMSCVTWLDWDKELTNNGHALVPIVDNLVDIIWEDKPPFHPKSIKAHPIEFAGLGYKDKITNVINKMKEKDAGVLIISALDEIAWLLNLRGNDINYNPVFFSYMIIMPDAVHIFPKNTNLPKDSIADYAGHHIPVTVHAYDQTFDFIKKEVLSQLNRIKKIWVPNSVNYYVYSLIPEKKRLSECSPILLMKAIKNETEIKGMVQAHIKDATALCRFFAWLEKEVPKGSVTEISAAEKLETFRLFEEHYVGPSFPTISSSGPNSAVIHYQPSEKSNRKLSCDEIYLCDSGGQYLDGTTDVTRTVHFGTPTDFEKECFTRVFKGQTALACAIFPNKLKGNSLDSFPRRALWEVGLDYPHGTSHGVGSYLHVHEGPIGISWRVYPDDPGLQANMILSNEPGYYHVNSFGIRLENIVQTIPAETPNNFHSTGYLTFKTLTLVPVQLKMLDPKLLTKQEIDYINQYHEMCKDVIGNILKNRGYKDAYEWLIKETQILG